MSVALSDQLIRDAMASHQGARCELADSGAPGLRLRIQARSARWSVLVEPPGSKRMRIQIGAWPDVGVGQARAFASALRTDSGAPEEEALTVLTLLNRYDARRLVQLKRGAEVKRALGRALRPVLHRRPEDLKRRELSAIFDDLADRTPIQANRSLAYTKAFFRWAIGRGYLETDPLAGIFRPSREVARERTPSLEELIEIWRACGDLGYPFGPAIRLLMLTASRRDEIGSMQIEELARDGEGVLTCWTLPADRSKNGRAIRTGLSSLAAAVAEEALRLRPQASPFLFSTTATTSISGWSKAKLRLDEFILERRKATNPNAMPIPAWRLHDLRRSFATLACDVLMVDPAIADRCLNHVGSSTTSTISRVYARSEMFLQRSAALQAWAELLENSGADFEIPR